MPNYGFGDSFNNIGPAALAAIACFIALGLGWILFTKVGLSTALTAVYKVAYFFEAFACGASLYSVGTRWLEKVLREDGPVLAQHLDQLAALLNAQEKYDLAEPLYKRSLLIYKKALRDHSSVRLMQALAITAEDYASLLELTGRPMLGKPTMLEVADILQEGGESDAAERLRQRCTND